MATKSSSKYSSNEKQFVSTPAPAPPPKLVLSNCEVPGKEPHQKHILPPAFKTVSDHIAYSEGGQHSLSGVGFHCDDVIAMEKKYGRHAEECPHVGYVASKVCGCVK